MLPDDLDAEDLLRRLNRSLRRAADQATPEFWQRMPSPYFRATDADTVLAHLSAVVAAKASGVAPRMFLKDPEERTWTFVHEQSYRGLLADLVEQLPRDQPLVSAKVHTATDGGLVLDVFVTDRRRPCRCPPCGGSPTGATGRHGQIYESNSPHP